MDPLHFFVAVGPLAAYLMLVGAINLGFRPFLTNGARDTAALGVGVSGLALVGPLSLFLPDNALQRFGPYAWLLMLALYALGLSLCVLLLRPRVIIYNVTLEQLRPLLASVVERLDTESHWAGPALVLPRLGVHLHLEAHAALRNVTLASTGPRQSYAGWRLLENELAAALRPLRVEPNLYGVALVALGSLLVLAAAARVYTDLDAVGQALTEMMRW